MSTSPKLVIVLAFLATFLAGAASMYLADIWLERSRSPTPADRWSEVANQLELSATQREQVDQIFARYQPSTDSVLASLTPRLAAVSDSIHREIEAILTPEQAATLKRFQKSATYIVRRKSPLGVRTDTLAMPPKR